MELLLLLITGIIALSQANEIHEEWNAFKDHHGKNYKNHHEDSLRMKIYLNTKTYIENHNKKFADGNVSFSMEINEFADLSEEEFHEWHLGFIKPCMDPEKEKTIHYPPPTGRNDLPNEVDWRAKGMVTPVKNQGKCGSCWAFSALGALEGQYQQKTGKLVSFSEQQLIDCTRYLFGNKGCHGGFTNRAFRYIKKKGVETEDSYPYQAKDLKCKYTEENVGANMTGYTRIKRGSQLALQDAVAKVGPVSIAIDVQKSFRFYKSGVYSEPGCGTGHVRLNHALLAVGYGLENGQEYWLVKNSWGEGWGNKGYIKMIRNTGNGCGIAESASYPLM